MRAALRGALVLAGLLAVAVALPAAATRRARPALLEIGPNDVGYTRGFRADWERDVRTRFRWTGLQASLHLPVHLHGDGHVLRMRLRRHFVEPATLAFRVEGRLVGTVTVAADPRVPYRIVELPLPPQDGRLFRLDIEARTAHPAPLGAAVDWMEVARGQPTAAFGLPHATLASFAGTVVALAVIVVLAGGPRPLALLLPGLLVAAAAWGAYADIVALERIVRLGTVPLLAVSAATAALVRLPGPRRWLVLDEDAPWAPAAMVVVVAGALALRLALLLHPQFYYPDVRVHGLFAWELARHGMEAFLRDYQANQFRYSLGLQTVGEHWYAFPYPPGFYVLSAPLIRFGWYRPEVAVSLVGATANALSALATWGVARRLGLVPAAAAAAAAVHATLPFFIARLTLAYFPALVGQALDAMVMLYVLAHLPRIAEVRRAAGLAILLACAFLTYTQSLLNFGVIFGLFAVAHVARTSGPPRRDRLRVVAALALAGIAAIGISTTVFYHRFLPSIAAMHEGRPVAEEQILLDKFARTPVDPHAVPEEPDPYAGPDLDLGRGLRKAGWRLYIFYGAFAPLAALGVVVALRAPRPPWSTLAISWAATYVVLNLASGGLPSPNLVRYNKDLEIVAPLICAGFGALGALIGLRSRWAAGLLGLSWLAFSGARTVQYLTEKFVLER